MQMTRKAFEELVSEALGRLPADVLAWMDNVVVIVQSFPTLQERREMGLKSRYQLLGLYYGVPLTERADYNFAVPDRIVLFQRAIEAECTTAMDVVEEIRRTVLHELAHHFGMDDQMLNELGL